MAPFTEMRSTWEEGTEAKEEERVEFGSVGCEMPDRLESADVERALQYMHLSPKKR